MKRKFATNLAFLIFVNFLVKPFWIFGIDLTVQNVVGPEDYGIYFALFNFSVLFHIVLDLGINNFNNRAVAQDTNFLQSYLPNILFLKIGLTLIYIIITLSGAFLLNFNNFQLKLLLLMAFNQSLVSLLLYFRSNVSGLHLFKIDSLLSVLDKLLMIFICGFLLWSRFFDGFKIEWFVYAQTISLGISVIIAFLIVIQKTNKLIINWNFNQVKEILKNTYPYALLGLLMSIYYRIDGVMIERMLPVTGAYEAGVYAASYRLLDAANMIGFLFATILLPMFARMFKQKEDVSDLLGESFKTLMTWSVFIVVMCIVYRNEIIGLLYPVSDDYWAKIFGLLISAYTGICSVYIFGTLLTANGSLRILNLIAISGVLLNIFLNYLLIRHYMAFGATIATIITQTLVAIAHLLAAISIFNLRVNFSRLLLFILFALGSGLTAYYLSGLSFDWKINLSLSILSSTILALACGLFDLKKIISLFNPSGEAL